MDPSEKHSDAAIEYPRGQVEILPPGEIRRAQGAGGRARPRRFERPEDARVFVIKSMSGGLVAMAFAGLVTIALFTFIASAFVILASVAALTFAGFYVRNRWRDWLGRGTPEAR
jgi:hypothetical protein